jgi:hypothetical protein
MTAKESRNKNFNAAFGTIFRICRYWLLILFVLLFMLFGHRWKHNRIRGYECSFLLEKGSWNLTYVSKRLLTKPCVFNAGIYIPVYYARLRSPNWSLCDSEFFLTILYSNRQLVPILV